MENTGLFGERGRMTSLVVFDTDAAQIQLKTDEDKIISNVESMADTVLNLEVPSFNLKKYFPRINLATCRKPHDSW